MDLFSILLIPGILFLFTVIFGIWLSRIGKPYHIILFNIHKLIALGTTVLAVVRFVKFDLTSPIPIQLVGLLVAVALGALLLFATGGIMSIREQDSKFVLAVHRISPFLIIISTLALYWMA